MWQLKIIILLSLTIISLNGVSTLQCHRCSFIQPYNLVTKVYIDYLLNYIYEKTGRNYQYNKDCQVNPGSHDLITPEPWPIPKFLETSFDFTLNVKNQMLNRTPGDATELDKFIMSKNFNYSEFSENLHPIAKPDITTCTTIKLSVTIPDLNLDLTVILRDGVVIPDLTPRAGNCLSQDEILGLMELTLTEEEIYEILRVVNDIQLCACGSKDGCNSNDLGPGGQWTTKSTTMAPKVDTTTPMPGKGNENGGNGSTPVIFRWWSVLASFLIFCAKWN